MLQAFAFLELFPNSNGSGESGIVTASGGGTDSVSFDAGANGGYAELTGLTLIGSSFVFTSGLTNDNAGQADGALAGIDVVLRPDIVGEPNPVPLPAAGWMLLAGVGGMTIVGRRRKSKE